MIICAYWLKRIFAFALTRDETVYVGTCRHKFLYLALQSIVERKEYRGMYKWPDSLYNILKEHYSAAPRLKGEKFFDQSAKDSLVMDLIAAYDLLSNEERIDVLIPKDGKVLKSSAVFFRDTEETDYYDYALAYDWPDNKGFLLKTEIQPGDMERQHGKFNAGEYYDRLGGIEGRYLSPFIGGKPQSLSSRALPYYIPEEDFTKNPSYHLYKATDTYMPDDTREIIECGSVAPAFCDKATPNGRGIQIYVCDTIAAYLSNGKPERKRVLIEKRKS